MLKFYYNPLSPNARRVWLTLLEKQISFEPMVIKMDGDQYEPDFLAINPFHHIPVVVDDGLRIVESIAIMDYLEAKYPTPALMPAEAGAIATVRMAQLVTANEFFPKVIPLICENKDSPKWQQAQQELPLAFMSDLLGDSTYIGGNMFSLGDIVAGIAIQLTVALGVPLESYPNLEQWQQRLMDRVPWQSTQISEPDLENFRRRVKVMVRLRQRAMRQS
ncbi:Stringent starvation protein A [Acaryochloris thomasi RCC1774]|uniref:Stringent starvation protein A n=1 Tax=Acaryochloris thomasi RCC1774 TaxID=1764569 RepID=A0A2W1JQT4_9CYAN|nr:glutathione S-transferase family protein [Acaryochloris thomasi]PZD71551.1 Stringent starvation protein A [Acaryochloris thomasi RCC1774]